MPTVRRQDEAGLRVHRREVCRDLVPEYHLFRRDGNRPRSHPMGLTALQFSVTICGHELILLPRRHPTSFHSPKSRCRQGVPKTSRDTVVIAATAWARSRLKRPTAETLTTTKRLEANLAHRCSHLSGLRSKRQ